MHVEVCVFRHRTRILVARGFDDVKNEAFLRPLGGAVEFDEMVLDALRREIREELGVEISDPVQLGVLENVFTYRGPLGSTPRLRALAATPRLQRPNLVTANASETRRISGIPLPVVLRNMWVRAK